LKDLEPETAKRESDAVLAEASRAENQRGEERAKGRCGGADEQGGNRVLTDGT
jgi:hypothetical protein